MANENCIKSTESQKKTMYKQKSRHIKLPINLILNKPGVILANHNTKIFTNDKEKPTF